MPLTVTTDVDISKYSNILSSSVIAGKSLITRQLMAELDKRIAYEKKKEQIKMLKDNWNDIV